jgi:UDP-N-acetylmuramoylalanine--D-glutamate ligase
VLSPGVPLTHPKPHPYVGQGEATRAGVKIIGDVELFFRAERNARFALDLPHRRRITGTNGKSTTTALTGHILKSCWAMRLEDRRQYRKAAVMTLDATDTASGQLCA